MRHGKCATPGRRPSGPGRGILHPGGHSGSVADPDPTDPHVIGHLGSGSGSTSQRYGSGSFYHHAKIVRKTLIPTIL